MQRFQSQHHQQQGGNSHQTPSPSAAQPSDQGSHMQSHYETLGRGPSGSIPLANPGPPPVAAPVVSKSNYNPFESMQRVPFPGALGGSQGQPTPADSGVQGMTPQSSDAETPCLPSCCTCHHVTVIVLISTMFEGCFCRSGDEDETTDVLPRRALLRW